MHASAVMPPKGKAKACCLIQQSCLISRYLASPIILPKVASSQNFSVFPIQYFTYPSLNCFILSIPYHFSYFNGQGSHPSSSWSQPTGQVQKPPAAPAGSGVEAARRLKAKLEKFYREVEGIPWNLGWKTG